MADAGGMPADESVRVLSGCNPVIVLGHLAAGGNERQGYLLAKGLAGRGFKPGVIAWTLTHDDDIYRSRLLDLDIPLAIAPQNDGTLAKVHWLRGIATRVRPPILHAYAFFLNAAVAWAMRGVGGVAVGSMRGDYEVEAAHGTFYYGVNRLWPKTIIANSAKARDAAASHRSPLRPRDILFVPNGLDLSQYSRRAHGPAGTTRVIGVGNLYPGKRWDRLVRAAARLRQSDPDLRFSVEIVGEGAERDNLTALIADLDLGNTVKLVGRSYDVPELLARSDVFALVSESEGAPNAVMEAMATGLPVLACDAGDVSRLVRNGVDGYVVGTGDEGALTEKLRALVASSELRARMGAEAFERAHAEFGLEQLVENTLSAYRHAGWRA